MSSPPQSSVSSDAHIRAKLLNRLGIYDGPPSTGAGNGPMTAAQNRRLRILRGMGVGYTLKPSPPDGSATRTPLGGVKSFQEPLKVDGIVPRKTKINFQNVVQVVPIPTRYEYSDRIKSRIWSNRHELQENAERNALEFAAEGWNWRNVTEDEGMYICSVSGELVHPIHLQHLVQEEAAAAAAAREAAAAATQPTEQTGLQRGAPVHST